MDVIQAGKQLPTTYVQKGVIDLSKDRKMLIIVNLAAMVMFVLFAVMFTWLAWLLRPEMTALEFIPEGTGGIFIFLLEVLAVSFVMVVAHEAIHGLFFWQITRERPLFGFRGAYAFAAAPEWYIPVRRYVWVGISPLVVITALGVALLAIFPQELVMPLLLLLVMNAAGAMGDLLVIGWILTKPATWLANDRGDSVTLYGPG